MVDERCAFRPVVLGALADEGIAWRTALANNGFTVALIGRREQPLFETKDAIGKAGAD